MGQKQTSLFCKSLLITTLTKKRSTQRIERFRNFNYLHYNTTKLARIVEGVKMENISLPPLLNDEIAKMAIKELLQFAKEEVKRELEAERLPINQKDLCKRFGFDHGYIKKLRRRGLKFRKQGREKMYDLKDVYEILEQEKEIEKC